MELTKAFALIFCVIGLCLFAVEIGERLNKLEQRIDKIEQQLDTMLNCTHE